MSSRSIDMNVALKYLYQFLPVNQVQCTDRPVKGSEEPINLLGNAEERRDWRLGSLETEHDAL